MKAQELRIGNLVFLEVNVPSLNIHEIMAQDILDIFRKDPRTKNISPSFGKAFFIDPPVPSRTSPSNEYSSLMPNDSSP